MITDQIPRNALGWIILSQLVLVAPHWQRVPLWILGIYLVSALWRYQIFAGRWSYPGAWTKAVLTLVSFVGIYLHFGSLLGLEPTVALLLSAYALKLLELARRKDAYIMLFLGYFVCITQFLFSQELPIVVYTLIPVLLLTTALLALHQHREDRFRISSLRHAGLMLLQAVPLMLVLFFLFPRIGPLWSVPLKNHSAKTGVSDFMKPGDISNLSQSDAVAFRAQFDGEIPPRSSLYWRGLVLSRLDDGAWRSLGFRDIPPSRRRPPPLERVGEVISYSVIMEPTQQNWLYALRLPESLDRKVVSSSDYRLYSPVEIQDEYQYRVDSWPQAILDRELSAWRRSVELALPADSNPRSRQLARDMRNRADSNRTFIESVLRMFNQQEFIYTLQPPLLQGEDVMDQFLFETRRGFCEHYAYAFTLMMRAAGVPARVVAGYQGGEINPVNGTVIVHQFDAHAWSEVWLEGQGWVRIDPTAAVSPDRIELGLEQAIAEEGSFLAGSPLSALHFRNVQWVNRLRLRYDALIYSWQKLVLGYDRDSQYQFLNDWLGEISASRFLQVVGLAWGLILLPLAWVLLYRGRTTPLSGPDRQIRRLSRKLARRNLVRQPGETLRGFIYRVSHQIPAHATRLRRIVDLYEQLSYAPLADDGAKQLKLLGDEVSQLRLQRV